MARATGPTVGYSIYSDKCNRYGVGSAIIMGKDYYKILDVPKNADDDTIKKGM